MPRLSVVVPVHNEASFLPSGLPALMEATYAADPEAEVIVVENGSSDGTAALAESIGGDRARVLRLPRPDYGDAMRTGFLEATGDWVVNFDIDYYSQDFLEQVLAADADLVIGSKRDPRSDDRRPFVRRLATRTFNLLLRTILGSRVSDTHGMKGFRKELVAELADRVVSRQDLYDTELVIRAERAGYRIVEVPVVVEELREARSSLLKRVPRTLRGLLRIRRALS
jgi:glycosyltransferase involved in cell wall biosynthesis